MGEQEKTLRRGWWFEDGQYTEAEAWLNDMAQQGWQLDHVGQRFAVFKPGGASMMRYACARDASYRTYEVDENNKVMDAFERAGWKYLDSHKGMLVFCAPAGTARPEITTESVNKRTLLDKAQPWIGALILLAFAVLFSHLFVYGFMTGKLAEALLHRGFLLFAMFVWIMLGIADFARDRRRAAGDPTESNDSATSYRRTYVRNRANRVLGIVMPFLFAFAGAFFPVTSSAPPSPLAHMAQISVSDIVKSKTDTGTFEYSVCHSLLYPQQMALWEYFDTTAAQDDYHGDAVLQFEEYRALVPPLAALLADELVKYDPAESRAHSQLQPDSDRLGFDRLWRSSDGEQATLLAQKGDEVYFLKIDRSVPLADMAAALQAKIAQAGGGK